MVTQNVLLGMTMHTDVLCSLVQVYHSPGLFVERQLRHAKKYKTAESPLLTPRSAQIVAALQHAEAGVPCLFLQMNCACTTLHSI